MQKPHEAAEGFERRCSVSSDGQHCMHGDTKRRGVEKCCWCGDEQPAAEVAHGQHGPAKVFEG